MDGHTRNATVPGDREESQRRQAVSAESGLNPDNQASSPPTADVNPLADSHLRPFSPNLNVDVPYA